MKKLVLVFLALACLRAFKLQVQDGVSPVSQKNKVKIPAYMGRGYHLLEGNPFTNHIDQGFKAPIFQFTYDKGQTTEDEKYLIPDFTFSTQATSCSLESKVTEFTGTQNYQKYLQSITKVDSRLSLAFLSAAFSFSNAFEQYSNSTQTHNETSSQSNAECTVYTTEMPLYSNQIKLSSDFVQGVKFAYGFDDWQQFISHFGTHYASSVVYGGRYFLQHTYSEASMSLFESLKLDVNIAAKVQYMQKIGAELSQDLKLYVNQTKVINSKISSQRVSTIGGQPPKSGNWIEWSNTVKDNLAPVSYKLITLSILFNFIQGIDVPAVIKSFQLYLNTFCEKKKCPPMTPQRPSPKPLVVSFTKSSQVRGQTCGPRLFDSNDGNIKVAMRVTKILLGNQGCIDSLQFFLSDGLVEHVLPVIGNGRPLSQGYVVPKQDEIRCIRFGIIYVSTSFKFTGIQFVTKKGVESPFFRGTQGISQYRVLCVQNDNQHFVGMFGHISDTFDSIGLNLMKETVQK